MQLIARQPRTTQELAPLIGLTEAGLSKHLRQLAAARLVRTRREGYILYRAEPESIAPVSEALLSYLHRPV